MNFFTKYRITTWILAGLLIIALSALGSVIYHTWIRTAPVTETHACSSSCQMMTAEIGLDDSQNTELQRILEKYRDTSELLLATLRENRMALMQALQNEPPDTAGIRFLAGEIGKNQATLTALAATQYLQIRSICSPDQQMRLSDVYCDLFGCPRVGTPHGEKQSQHRYRKERGCQ